jgi:hypothetical protein
MMREFFLLILAFQVFCEVQAQSCSPDPNNKALFGYPQGSTFKDGFWYFPKAYEELSYSENFQIKLPKDTTVQVPGGSTTLTVPVVHSIVDSVTGLPKGLNFACNPADCKFLAEKNGCIVLYGTVPKGNIGRYQIRIYGRTEVKVFGLPTVLPGSLERFFIEVADIATSLEPSEDEPIFYPNPANKSFTFKLKEGQVIALRATGITGQRSNLEFIFSQNTCTADIKPLSKGLYWIEIETSTGISGSRLLVE